MRTILKIATARDEQPAGTRVTWSELALPGTTLTLLHSTEIQIFRFRSDAMAVATIGRDGPDGAVAGPLLYWGEDGQYLVISNDPDAVRQEKHRHTTENGVHIMAVLGEPTVDDGILTATNVSDERVSYRLTRNWTPH